jgi:lipoyl(octanoyl) transferase
MKYVRVPDFEREPAYMNMATDEAIALSLKGTEGDEIGTLRFYTWPIKTITIGKEQSTSSLNIDVLRKYAFVRRPTGGTAILHDEDFTYSLAIKKGFLSENILGSYKQIVTGILHGLKHLGLEAKFRDEEMERKTASCYTNKNPYDILVNEKKISGNAQTRDIEGIVLQQGTIIVKPYDAESIAGIYDYNGEERKEFVDKTKSSIISLEEALGRKTNFAEVEQAFLKGFGKAFEKLGIILKAGELTEQEIELASTTLKNVYLSERWNYEGKRK